MLGSSFSDSTYPSETLEGDPLLFAFTTIWCPDDRITGAREIQTEKQSWRHMLEPKHMAAAAAEEGQRVSAWEVSRLRRGGQAFETVTNLAPFIQDYIFHC